MQSQVEHTTLVSVSHVIQQSVQGALEPAGLLGNRSAPRNGNLVETPESLSGRVEDIGKDELYNPVFVL